MLPLHHDPGENRSGVVRFSRVVMSITSHQSQSRHDARSHWPVLPIAAKNRDGRIRTGDLLLPRQADYQTFLHPVAIAREGVEPSSPP